MDASVLTEVVSHEERLLDPECRADAACLRGLLHPDFLEYGASGRVWTRDGVLQGLAADPTLDGTGANFTATPLADDVVLVTFRLTGGQLTSLRSSIWVRCEDGQWRVRFHQGTPTA